MNSLEWTLVALTNGAIIAFGFWYSRGNQSSVDWFLGGRSLPWWLIGLSMYATAIDSSDLVADSGFTYRIGMAYFVANWVGIVVGWGLASHFVFLPMYRAGMYTNAEYLEARFGVGVRILCALIQVQYRTLVLGIMGETLYLTLHVVGGWDPFTAWSGVVAIAVLAAFYTTVGGLRGVAVTDALQFVVMTLAALIIWFFVWDKVGGWEGIETRLAEEDAALPAEMLHIGQDNLERVSVPEDSVPSAPSREERVRRQLLLGGELQSASDPSGDAVRSAVIVRRTPAWLVSLAFVIMGIGYSIVNHTQSMRMFGARNEWHLKMSVVVASLAMLAMSFINLTMGIMGRALYPDQTILPDGRQDAIYPYLVSQFETVGLKGLVVAGILAASFSTYDSIGSSLSALVTRDVYARILRRDADDRHYLRAGQWLVPIIIAISFFYLPFLKSGMLMFYLELTSAFVTPLLTLFLMGALTRVHRSSGAIGLAVGAGYGVFRLFAVPVAENYGFAVLPAWASNTYAAYPISIALTSGSMVVVSLVRGWQPAGTPLRGENTAWLRSSQEALQAVSGPDAVREREAAGWLPSLLTLGVVGIGLYLSYVVFW